MKDIHIKENEAKKGIKEKIKIADRGAKDEEVRREKRKSRLQGFLM